MTYQEGTITSLTPAKDLMAALKTPLTSGGLQFVETYWAPANQNWSSVAYGNGVFVAVAQSTTIVASSTDGATWTPRTLPVSATWISVTFGNGVFVAIANGSNYAITSSDGAIWNVRALPVSANWSAVTYGNGLFVAIASGTAIAATSPDGNTWTQRSLPSSQTWSSVTYGNGLFVAIANGTATSATSPDGITWTQRTLPASLSWSSVIYGGSLFVAVANTTIGYTSPDGIAWTSRTLPGAANWSSIAYGNGTFLVIASGPSNAAASSTDGTTWVSQTLPSSASWSSVTYGNSMFVATALNMSTAATSTTGASGSWTSRTLPPPAGNAVADVYKSPAASNVFGQDWYLILRRASDTATALFYQVAESYNSTTHLVSNYGGRGVTTTPVATTFRNPDAASAPDVAATFGSSAQLGILTSAQSFPWRVSATPNRVVVAIVSGASEYALYAGLYEDLLPTGVTQFPLVCAQIPLLQTVGWAIGGGSQLAPGGFTREPGQAAPSNLNFEARIHNGYVVDGLGVLPAGFTPMPTTQALYGNYCAVSRVMLGSARTTAKLSDALRGLLYGCVASSYLSVAGDTLTSDGKTYVRVAGPTTTYGIFVDRSL